MRRRQNMKKQGSRKAPIITYNIPQMIFGFNDEKCVEFEGTSMSSLDAANVIRTVFDKGEMGMREVFVVLFFNEANEPIGTYKHSTGGRDQTLVDLGLVLGAALTSLSSGMILAHNHPVGDPNPSLADLEITMQFIEAAKYHNLTIIDHIILTSKGHLSMAEYGLLGKESPYPLVAPEGVLDPNDIDLSQAEFIVDMGTEEDE
ncbi:MAG: JAB domain-containing protein [Crocinitomicaceae bacterium]